MPAVPSMRIGDVRLGAAQRQAGWPEGVRGSTVTRIQRQILQGPHYGFTPFCHNCTSYCPQGWKQGETLLCKQTPLLDGFILSTMLLEMQRRVSKLLRLLLKMRPQLWRSSGVVMAHTSVFEGCEASVGGGATYSTASNTLKGPLLRTVAFECARFCMMYFCSSGDPL